MLFMFYYSSDVAAHIFMYSSSLFYKLLGCPVADVTMSRGQVLIKGSVMIIALMAAMRSYTFIVVEDLYTRSTKEYPYFLAYILIGYTVVMPVSTQTSVSVLHYCNSGLLLKLIPVYR